MSFKSFILSVIVIACLSSVTAQKSVYLNIDHLFESADVSFSETMKYGATNFNFERIDYYLSEFKFVLSNGDEVAVDDSYALVRSSDPVSMYLGDVEAADISGLKFSIGVGKDINHQDPAAWPADHPLNYQDPSMHWGWSGGYIFFVFNGFVDTSGGQPTEFYDFQAIGDEMMRSYEMELNYGIEEDEESIHINIVADYQALLEALPLPSIQHGSGTTVTKMMNNIIDNQMFSEKMPSNVDGLENEKRNISIFPNPAERNINLSVTERTLGDRIQIINTVGQVIQQIDLGVNNDVIQLQIDHKGIYFVQLINASNRLVNSSKLIVIE